MTVDSLVSPAGDRLGVKSGSSLNWFLPDPHGNVAGSLDPSEATLVNAIRYDAYGQTIATGSAGGTSVAADVWKYQARLDVSPAGLSTPLYDMSARFYNPGIGAFTQLDSVMGGAGNPLSMNRFLYALANPATLIDPSGHFATRCDGGCGTSTPALVANARRAAQHSYVRETTGKKRNYSWTRGSDPFDVHDSHWVGSYQMSTPDKHDGPGWFLVGAAEGVVGVAVATVQTPVYAVTHLSEAAKGFECFTQDGCLARAGHTLGWDHPVDNFVKGTQYVHDQPDEYKGQFAATVSLTGALLGRGTSGFLKSRASVSEPQVAPCDLFCFGNTKAPRPPRETDISIGPNGKIIPNPAQGASAWADPALAPMKGPYYVLPKGAAIPRDLVLTRDELPIGHFTISPSRPMSLGDFQRLFSGLPSKFPFVGRN